MLTRVRALHAKTTLHWNQTIRTRFMSDMHGLQILLGLQRLKKSSLPVSQKYITAAELQLQHQVSAKNISRFQHRKRRKDLKSPSSQ